jgi:DNA repair protein SbcC/Rad50
MIIRSMRLKNIKSYGEGPDGHGVTISFEPGTNRIAGKNGHGKTTLIESLGYALFLTEPIFEENFLIETYFIRAGKKSAEIDVTFSHQGEDFRIERGLGPNSKRQTKVVQPDDGSTCAEGEKEISAFLCRLLGLPNPRRLTELFWKLIGVRQGRITFPFDSKPAAAKEFFEPLLDVAVFRECFLSLKPAVDEFIERRHEREKIKASVEERIRERSDSAAGLEEKRRQLKEIELHLQALNKSRDETLNTLAQLEATENSLKTAESQLSAARNAFDLARQQCEIAEQRMQESMAAGNIVELTALGYQAYENAGKELLELRAKQADQHRLEIEMAGAEKKKVEIDAKGNAARSQTYVFARQKQEKEAERSAIRNRIEAIRTRLRVSEAEFERQKSLTNRASSWLSDIHHFVSSFANLLAHGETALTRMKEMAVLRAATDSFAVEKARNREKAADEALQAIRQQLAAANADYSTLKRQLEEIGGGICPFLKERCRQFDPSKVTGDLKEKSATIEMLEEKRRIAESALHAAQAGHKQQRQQENSLAVKSSQLEQTVADFSSALKRLTWQALREAADGLRQWIQPVESMPDCPELVSRGAAPDAFERYHLQSVAYLTELQKWWQETDVVVQDRINAVRQEESRRNADCRDEINFSDNLGRIESEIEKLAIAENEQLEAAAACTKESAELEKTIASFYERRKAFGFFGDQIVLLEQAQQKFRKDYERYLGAKSLADEGKSRDIELNARREQELRANEQLRLSETKVLELSRAFDAAVLKATRRKYEEINAAAAMELANLNNARREMEREESRFWQWQEACATRDGIVREVQRLEAAIELTELARTVLRESAPAVAQHLCHRIAARAQQIFNQINHDPVELKWEAAPRYSLRIIPGDRRFAMLSGGEQTKLALAMTLAMIQELSGLRFCIFDEPTYGVDVESREKLGDVMLDAQKAADLEQLILVSHDGAFDGKIEHSIFLRKTAPHGTEVVQFPSHIR